MGTPVNELPQPQYLNSNSQYSNNAVDSDDEGTLSNDQDRPEGSNTNDKQNYLGGTTSQSRSREEHNRLQDDLAMLQAERVISRSQSRYNNSSGRSISMNRSRTRQEPADTFDISTNPIHERAAAFKPPENPAGRVAKAFKRVHESSFLVRWFCYIVPLVLVFLIPLLLGALLFEHASVGGVRLLWFSVWLEIVWLTLWAGRLVAKALPWPVGMVCSLFTNNSKKWRDMCKQLEIPATMFFWMLAVLISFLPTMVNHHLDGKRAIKKWEVTMNKIIISFFVGMTLNFIEKIIIQLIAISFHLRTYADRIEINKFQIGSLTKLYQYSKDKIALEDSDFEDKDPSQRPGSGARTPMQYLNEAQKKTRSVFGKVGDAAGKVAGDFTGKTVTKSTHPRQLVLLLLSSPAQSQILARRLYRTFAKEDAETISQDDLKNAFDNEEEADSAFAMFDKDLNGDISMSELEAVCVEIGKERKSITASLKDLDSVVAKLDAVLLFFVVIATILIFLSLISTSAAGVLTSAGSAVLALSWLFSTTAQEFLASCIFVLVKHPFDVGDRVTIYGNTGSTLKGDDYLVKEISLLYTEFKKLEGQIVQAPNSYLNTLFILNMRRSGGLAEAVSLTVKFGTTLQEIDELRERLLEYVKAEKREYQPNILTEIRDVVEAHSVNLNVIFFYKSNWQNELLRLQRRNKFICAMMVAMQEIGIEGPRRRIPGAKEDTPFYYTHAPPKYTEIGNGSQHGPDGQGELKTINESRSESDHDSLFRPSSHDDGSLHRHRSILRGHGSNSRIGRQRGESISAMSKRVDFSLGMKDVSSADLLGDLEERKKPQLPINRADSRDPRARLAEDDDAEREAEARTSGTIQRDPSRSMGNRRHFGIHRTGTTDNQSIRRDSSTVHRNRFFGKGKRRGNVSEEEDLMEQGMVDIVEASTPPHERSDPRTGIISPQAVCPSTETDLSVTRPAQQLTEGSPSAPQQAGVVPSFEQRMQLQHTATTTAAEDFEMRNMGA